jgi:hypothetical protein
MSALQLSPSFCQRTSQSFNKFGGKYLTLPYVMLRYDEQLFEDLRKVHSDYRERLRRDGIDYMEYPLLELHNQNL